MTRGEQQLRRAITAAKKLRNGLHRALEDQRLPAVTRDLLRVHHVEAAKLHDELVARLRVLVEAPPAEREAARAP